MTRLGSIRSSRPPGAARGGAALRILGGALRGRRLRVASGVRPTGSRLREALFSIWGPRIEGARFLDLFAGSGAVGLEALSRGARCAVFVESDPRMLRALERNLGELAPEVSRVWRLRLPGAEGQAEGTFDLIFADPPYRFSAYPELLRRAAPWLAPGGELAVEHSARCEIPGDLEPLRRVDLRRYGDSCLSFFRAESAGARGGR